MLLAPMILAALRSGQFSNSQNSTSQEDNDVEKESVDNNEESIGESSALDKCDELKSDGKDRFICLLLSLDVSKRTIASFFC